jgi:hypothetical protein
MVIFHSYVNVYQRVSGTFRKLWAFWEPGFKDGDPTNFRGCEKNCLFWRPSWPFMNLINIYEPRLHGQIFTIFPVDCSKNPWESISEGHLLSIFPTESLDSCCFWLFGGYILKISLNQSIQKFRHGCFSKDYPWIAYIKPIQSCQQYWINESLNHDWVDMYNLA